MIEIPEPAVKLAGFPTCLTMDCRREVAGFADYCSECGGAMPTIEIIRRTMLRHLLGAVKEIMACCPEKRDGARWALESGGRSSSRPASWSSPN